MWTEVFQRLTRNFVHCFKPVYHDPAYRRFSISQNLYSVGFRSNTATSCFIRYRPKNLRISYYVAETQLSIINPNPNHERGEHNHAVICCSVSKIKL